jgi:hypothetical protein
MKDAGKARDTYPLRVPLDRTWNVFDTPIVSACLTL